MNLCYTLPPLELELAQKALGKEKIQYCSPYDIRLDGTFFESGWVAASNKILLVFEDGKIIHQLLLSECSDAACSNQVNNGLFVITHLKEELILARFSMRHIKRYSYIARGIMLFIKGNTILIESNELEETCDICGRALLGTRICAHCHGKKHIGSRLKELIAQYKFKLLLITVIMVLISSFGIILGFAERSYIDHVLIPRNTALAPSLIFFSLIIAIGISGATLTSVRNFMSVKLGAQISKDLRQRIYSKLQELSLNYIGSRQPGEIINRVMNDSDAVRQFLQEGFAFAFNRVIQMVGILSVMLALNWKLTLLSISFAPIVLIVSSLFWSFIIRIFRIQWRMGDELNNHLRDVLSGIRVVKAFGMEDKEIERFKKVNRRYATVQVRNETFWSTLSPLLTFLVSIGSFIVLFIGGAGYIQGTGMIHSVGELTQFITYSAMLYGPLSGLIFFPRQITQTITSLQRIFDILDEPADISQNQNAIGKGIKGEVSIKNITFGYHSYEPVLENITLHVKAGERIGIVGASGTGKSTLINLLMRLYDVDEGNIIVDGTDIREYRLQSLHSQIGVVLQDPFLFSGSILENIRYAKPDSQLEEIIIAAKIANAHDFICKLPDGYNTKVGENGYTLSGGERQRVSIARAILNDPKILILDEATSSLDTETEYLIQNAFERLMKGRTTFAIAHRLSTLRNCDRILVLDKHKLIEIGTHKELMQNKGLYFNLVMAQLQLHSVKEA